MDFLAVPDAWPSAAAALHVLAVQFESAELTAEVFRDRAVRILEELSATSPSADAGAFSDHRHAAADLSTRESSRGDSNSGNGFGEGCEDLPHMRTAIDHIRADPAKIARLSQVVAAEIDRRKSFHNP